MNKILFNALLLIFVASLFSSCDQQLDYSLDIEDIQINQTIPDEVYNFLDEHYAKYAKRKIKKKDVCSDSLIIEVELKEGPEGDVDVYFREDGSFWFTASKINMEDIPEEILVQVDSLDSELMINPNDVEFWEITTDSIIIKLELKSKSQHLDVLFALSGEVVCLNDVSDDKKEYSDDDDDDEKDGEHDDDDDKDGKDDDGSDEGDSNDDNGDDQDDDGSNDDNDDDDDDNGDDDYVEVPTDALIIINLHYPSFRAKKTKKDKVCGDEVYYEVEIQGEDGTELVIYFSLDWNLQFESTKVKTADLPEAIITTIETDFEGYTIKSNNIKKLTRLDGIVQYRVQLKKAKSKTLTILFNEDGTIACE